MSPVQALVLKDQGEETQTLEWVGQRAKPRKALLHHVAKYRGGHRKTHTASTKLRSEVSGGGKKPWRQKGTGRARQGSTRSPQWRHGGVVFGPKPRKPNLVVNRLALKASLSDALGTRAAEGRVAILGAGLPSQGKAKEGQALVKRLPWAGPTLVVCNPDQDQARRAFRNLKNVSVASPSQLRCDQVLGHQGILLTGEAAEALKARMPSAGKSQ